MAKSKDIPEKLRPYIFHGLEVSIKPGKDSYANCPWCQGEDKLGISNATGKFRCNKCDVKPGNAYTFIRQIWQDSFDQTTTEDYRTLSNDRNFMYAETPMLWDLAKSFITGNWLFPCYNEEKKIVQVYQYSQMYENGQPSRMAWLLTPTLGHKLFGLQHYRPKVNNIWLVEGLWDALALWEFMKSVKEVDGEYKITSNQSSSLLNDCDVLAIPGNMTFFDSWTDLFHGKNLILGCQNDHERKDPESKRIIPAASYNGMKRVAGLLADSRTPPETLEMIHWGENGTGYDPERKHGYDIRDMLKKKPKSIKEFPTPLEQRIKNFKQLTDLVGPLPEGWFTPGTKHGNHITHEYSVKCTSFKDVVSAWRKAVKWRENMGDVLCFMLAIAASTNQVGDQIFGQVIGPPGCMKTRFCDAMLTSPHCYALEHITGFHSGWKDESGKDFSLISRINHKTLITPEGDVVMSGPKFVEIMSQQRRIFDGTTGATYKSRDEDLRYTGLRTPWIIAGTPEIMAKEQSGLGDRFLKKFFDDPDEEEKGDIYRRVGFSALRAVMQNSEDNADGHLDPKMAEAYKLTGGYVDYLRENITDLLAELKIDEEYVVERCSLMGQYTADLRARPSLNFKREVKPTKEMATRLTSQYTRLACCTAVVLNQPEVNDEVMRQIKSVSIDTCRGASQDIVNLLYEKPEGLTMESLRFKSQHHGTFVRDMVNFMRHKDINILETATTKPKQGKGSRSGINVFLLTDRMMQIMEGYRTLLP